MPADPERAFDLDDVVLVEAVHLDDGARRIGAVTPQLGLHPVDDRPEAEHVGDVDDEAHGIFQRRALGLRNRLHVAERLAHARFFASDQCICPGIDAAHAGDVEDIAGAAGEPPGAGRLDGAGRRNGPHAGRRRLLRHGGRNEGDRESSGDGGEFRHGDGFR